ncbi:lipopolysaccharide biosynthesis protein [Novosphingobium sp. MBES04]|uniref:lipopolysaccharide biosynthesis protein n=1 Tax=Novosphingobium sp. MBES04 TaxID=1206458 RepID=UPI0006933643|nr:lipopolysaccharide biosynthesis protein [Novosphingobium sp. MBES04]GAM06067.1 polysaccharide biosynthesis protein [Novosphingobium sp. MBES04]
MTDLIGPTPRAARRHASPPASGPPRASLRERWQRSTLIRPRLVSLAHLMSGSLGAAVLMMATLAIATRALGTQAFGTFVIVLTISRTCERLVRFESWQPLIRFVAAEEENASPERLASLYAYGLLLDIASALGAALLAVIVALVAGPLLGLDGDARFLVAIYALAIAGNLRGMASAALRLAGRFRVLAYVQLAAVLLRLTLACLLYVLGREITEFVVAWTVSQLFDSLLFNALGLRTLKQTGIPSPWRADKRHLPSKFPGFLRFAISTNLSSGLRTLTHEMDTLLVSTLAGPAAAGLYYLSRRIAKVVQTAGDLLQTIIYPDLARLWNQSSRKGVRRLVTMLQLALGGIGLVTLALCWLMGRPLLEFVFGDAFSGSFALLLAQLVAIMLMLHAAPARSALLAMNRPSFVLACSVLATFAFFITATLMVPRYGAIGANFAHIVFGLMLVLAFDIALHGRLAASRRPEPVSASTKEPLP